MIVLYPDRVTVARRANIFSFQALAISPEEASLTRVALSACRSMLTVHTHPTSTTIVVQREWVKCVIVDAFSCMTVALT